MLSANTAFTAVKLQVPTFTITAALAIALFINPEALPRAATASAPRGNAAKKSRVFITITLKKFKRE